MGDEEWRSRKITTERTSTGVYMFFFCFFSLCLCARAKVSFFFFCVCGYLTGRQDISIEEVEPYARFKASPLVLLVFSRAIFFLHIHIAQGLLGRETQHNTKEGDQLTTSTNHSIECKEQCEAETTMRRTF